MNDKSPAAQIDDIIKKHGGWKGQTLAALRAAIRRADPEVVEQVKWRMPTRPEGLPVWEHNGNICLAETLKDNIKLVFVKGAKMAKLQALFNARLLSSTDRAIEFHDGDAVDPAAIKRLVAEAIKLNDSK